MIHARIKHVLELAQPGEQAGFRSGYSCADHLHTITQVIEKMNEFKRPLWICAIDFQKAFDTVEHASIWKALLAQGVPSRYVALLQDLYAGQTGQVITDRESKVFQISRGTKQGDPISPALFSAVLEDAISGTVKTWNANKYGLQFGDDPHDRLTNLRFADDILLLANSQAEMVAMIADLKVAAGQVGLVLHMGKTKILTNQYANNCKDAHVCNIGDDQVQVLGQHDATAYLGRSLNAYCA